MGSLNASPPVLMTSRCNCPSPPSASLAGAKRPRLPEAAVLEKYVRLATGVVPFHSVRTLRCRGSRDSSLHSPVPPVAVIRVVRVTVALYKPKQEAVSHVRTVNLVFPHYRWDFEFP